MVTCSFSTARNKQVLDITKEVNAFIRKEGVEEGVIHLCVLHTTAALSTADLDPGTDLDMLDAFYEIMPNLEYRHPHNPEHTPDHILSTLIGTSLTLPVQDNALVLGVWQRVVLFEFDGPRDRKVVLSFID